jgi:hypothetical protein
MKQTFDNKDVPARCYYYLLDFNQQDDWKTIFEIEPDSEGRLFMLTYEQFWKLWEIATKKEMSNFSK